jgi:ferredoxin/flavodoxin---NADP+ reductase
MSNLNQERVCSVHHWNDSLFSFKTTRDPGLRFQSGHFVMLGLEVEGRPLLRAFSFASANYEDHLEFYSIKVPGGPLTSRLQHIKPGDPILVGRKPTGTLLLDHLEPGKRLYLLGTGTGLAPFMSIIRDPVVFERFDHVTVVHGVRFASELGYSSYIKDELPDHELVGEQVKRQLRYYPTVTRERTAAIPSHARITSLIESGKMTADLDFPALDPEHDRVMVCGGPSMLRDVVGLLGARGFEEGSSHGPGQHVIERAFAER